MSILLRHKVIIHWKSLRSATCLDVFKPAMSDSWQKIVLPMELTVCKTHPPLVTVAMPDIHAALTQHMFSHSEKYNRRKDRVSYYWYVSAFKLCNFKRNSNKKYRFVALQCVVTDHCIVSHITSWTDCLIIYTLSMNKHQKVFNFHRGTHHVSSLSRCSCGSVVEHCVCCAKGCGFDSQGTYVLMKMYNLNVIVSRFE